MSWNYRPYVPVAARRSLAAQEILRMEQEGKKIEPLGDLSHRTKIATSFWGRAWCDHLEALGDYENRLPRGRTYVRNGSVLHLAVKPGRIEALVQGSDLYEQTIRIDPLPAARWTKIRKRCRGGVGSLIELLQGRISDEIMGIVTDGKDGLFPRPGEVHLDCSCPDWAGLCKHLAAVLYGIGARLDQRPELLFVLRGVDHSELVDESVIGETLAGSGSGAGPERRRTLDESVLGDVFGIDLDEAAESEESPVSADPGLGERIPGGSVPGLEGEFEATAQTVCALRREIGLSVTEFAEWVGVSRASVVQWEKSPGLLRLRKENRANLEALYYGLRHSVE